MIGQAKRFMMKKQESVLSNIRPSWHELFVEATILFSKRSSCVKAKQAALLVKDNRIISCGVNGSPVGQINCVEEEDGEEKCGKDSMGSCWLGIHAEQNAIGYAARNGISTEGCTMYVTQTPCISCAKLVVASGIKEYYYINDYRLEDGKRFLESCDIKLCKIEK